MPNSVAEAFVTLRPDMSGFESEAASALKGSMGKLAAVVAEGALTVAFLKISDDYKHATESIAADTGKTGAALKALDGDMLNVFKSVPTSMGNAAIAVGDLNVRLGLVGAPLEELSKKFITLAHITGTDLKSDITTITQSFANWNIATEDQSLTLDKLLKASQLTGIGIGELSSEVTQFGPLLRQFGFSFDQSIAILAEFNKNGVDAGAVMAGLKRALATLSKAGEDPAATLERVTEAIKAAGTAGEANALAIELFGNKAGPAMAAAIRDGRFSIDELVSSLSMAGGTVEETQKSFEGWRENLTLIKNNVTATIAPFADMAAAVVSIGGSALLMVGEAVPAFKEAKAAVEAMGAAMKGLNIAMAASVVTIGLVVAALAVMYIAHQRAENAANKASAVQKILDTQTAESIRQNRDMAASNLERLKSQEAGYDAIKGGVIQLDLYNNAVAALDKSLGDQKLSTDGVTSASEAMAGKVDTATQAEKDAAAAAEAVAVAADIAQREFTSWDGIIQGVNRNLDYMTKASGEAFSAIDKFKSVPTVEQLELGAAIATNNAQLAEAKQRLDAAKAAGDLNTGALEAQIKSLDAEKLRLDDANKVLETNREKTAAVEKAKAGASGAIDGMVKSEGDLEYQSGQTAAALSGQETDASRLHATTDIVKEKFGQLVDLFQGRGSTSIFEVSDAFGQTRDQADRAQAGLDGVKDSMGEFTSGSGAFLSTLERIQGWLGGVAGAADIAAAEISRMQQIAANPVAIPQLAPGPASAPFNARGTSSWRGGITWVGEEGPELVNLPAGSQVLPHAQSMAFASNMPGLAGGTGGIDSIAVALGGVTTAAPPAMGSIEQLIAMWDQYVTHFTGDFSYLTAYWANFNVTAKQLADGMVGFIAEDFSLVNASFYDLSDTTATSTGAIVGSFSNLTAGAKASLAPLTPFLTSVADAVARWGTGIVASMSATYTQALAISAAIAAQASSGGTAAILGGSTAPADLAAGSGLSNDASIAAAQAADLRRLTGVAAASTSYNLGVTAENAAAIAAAYQFSSAALGAAGVGGDDPDNIGRDNSGSGIFYPDLARQQLEAAAASGLASGGIVRAKDGGTLVRLGEGGYDEAVVPLDGRHGGGWRGGLRDVFGGLQVVLPNVRNGSDLFRELDRLVTA